MNVFDAVVLAGGSTTPRDLPIAGREVRGVEFAMDFLRQANRRVAGLPIPEGTDILATGQAVVVIGGGDTGSDPREAAVLTDALPHHPRTTDLGQRSDDEQQDGPHHGHGEPRYLSRVSALRPQIGA